MNRRSFLGSLIGFVAAMPFAARLFHEPEIETFPFDPRFRMLFRDSISGFTIQAPKVKPPFKEKGAWKFEAHELLCVQALTLDQVILLTSGGRILANQQYENGSVHCIKGDKLTVTFSITDVTINMSWS